MAVFSKLKQFKELRDQAKEMQDILAKETVYADANHGKVQIIMDGNQHVSGVSIDDEYFAPNKKDDLQKHMADAINSAVKKAQMAMAKKAKELGKIDLPGI